jgi:hypothetical protein
MAEIELAGVRRPIRYSRKRLPEEWDGLWMQAYSDDDVQTVLSGYEPLLLVPSGKQHADDAELKVNSQPADAWQLREDFLRREIATANIVDFLNEWGRWNSSDFIEVQEISRLQQAIREAMTTASGKWFSTEYSLPANWQRKTEYPYFSLLTDKAEGALCMTVTADLLNESRFKICARPDCGQPFKVESKHERKFCSRSCAHIEAVRRSRREKGAETSIQGAGSTKGASVS